MSAYDDYDEQNTIYKMNLPDAFVGDAVFSDGTKLFRNPPEPMAYDELTIRIRTAIDNVKSVLLVAGNIQYTMEKAESDPLFDYYEKKLVLTDIKMEYYFVIEYDNQFFYYSRIGITDEKNCKNYRFAVVPGFKTPEWAKGAVMYQIFTDRFCNGDVGNDVLTNEYFYINDKVVHVDDWYKYPSATSVREFYGGDISGIIKKLDYIKSLGIEVIYLNPVFVSPSNHKYDIQDYDYVDPHFGVIIADAGECLKDGENSNEKATRFICRVTNKNNLEATNINFAFFVEQVHKRGMRIILDGVFNHCGSFNKWLDREKIYKGAEGYAPGAYISEDSPYRDFFKFRDNKWPDNTSYDGWWGYETLPKLNYEASQELEDYVLGIAKKWLSPPFNVDGWRLDVAADLGYSPDYNHRFWKKFREAVKSVNPNALILAEHYGDAYDWLQGNEWDSVMNYDAFMEPLTWFLTGMEKHSDESNDGLYRNADAFFETMSYFMTRFETQSLQVAMNELSNHDHSRFMTRTNRCVGRSHTLGAEAANQGINPAVMREAVVVQMTWPGAPTVYYGDEAGVCGWSDPDNRRTYPWGREDKSLIDFHKEAIRIHKAYNALKTGSLIYLYKSYGVIAYGRFDETDKFIIAVNNNSGAVEAEIPVWMLGILEGAPIVRLLRTSESGYGFEMVMYRSKLGKIKITLDPFSAVILKNMPQME